MKDPEIRALLRRTILRKYLSDPDSKVVEELRLSPANAQVDIAIINGSLHAFEIKSGSDTLNRLPNQIKCYSRVFDYVTIVTEGSHLKKVVDIVPEWVGIAVCTDDQLEKTRNAKRNIDLNPFYIAQLLWRDEMKSLLLDNGVAFRSHHRNWILSELLAAEIETSKLSRCVRDKLKRRINWKPSDLLMSCGDSNL
jgi:hypothetical protein